MAFNSRPSTATCPYGGPTDFGHTHVVSAHIGFATHSQEGGYDALNLARGGSRSSCDSRSSGWSGHCERVSPGEQCENWHVETQRGEVQVQSRPGTPK